MSGQFKFRFAKYNDAVQMREDSSSEDGSRDAFTYANCPSGSISTEWISNTASEIEVQV